MRLCLYRGDTPVDEGTGNNVLDGPLRALQYFVRELARCPDAPSLQALDIVTTGTWTDAWPVEAGQCWRSEFDSGLGPLSITLA